MDAGSHLAAITKILTDHFPEISDGPQPRVSIAALTGSQNVEGSDDNESNNSLSDRSLSPEPTVITTGPFQGASFPHKSARANAVHFVREQVDAYLITHPHLDHISGFAINTAAFHNTSRPKKLSALPFTVDAIKQHIFNDVIWPNLTDEEGGVGFVSFQRLTEGGNLALGDGHSRGFIEVCNGLAVKAFKISHGNCASAPRPDRRNSGVAGGINQSQLPQGQGTPHHSHHGNSRSASYTHNGPSMSAIKFDNLPIGGTEGARRTSVFSQPSQPGTPTFFQGGGQDNGTHHHPVVDSTAYFIRAVDSGREMLIFGDVEPDSISLSPRNHIVWAEAAPKVAAGLLQGIFIECSYNDTQSDNILFGHLAPRHLIAELQTLADMVGEKKKELNDKAAKKRKRMSSRLSSGRTRSQRDASSKASHWSPGAGESPMHAIVQEEPGPEEAESLPPSKVEAPLKGIKIIIIHVKDSMLDGPPVGVSILQDLNAHETRLAREGRGLGCSFEISRSGASYEV